MKKRRDFISLFLMLIFTATVVSCGGGGGGGGGGAPAATTPSGQATSTIVQTPAVNPDEVDISNLRAYLAGKPANTVTTAYPIKVTGLTTTNWTSIITALRANRTKYVNLSSTVLPEGITDMESGFRDCTSLTTAPAIPSGVTNMYNCFDGCTSLTTAPAIPSSVTNMGYCFSRCTSLTTAPVIPGSVTDMHSCFKGCTSLTTAPAIPSSVTNMGYCFQGCTLLTISEIHATITDNNRWVLCFNNCTAITSIQVPNSTVKDAILAASGNTAVAGANVTWTFAP